MTSQCGTEAGSARPRPPAASCKVSIGLAVTTAEISPDQTWVEGGLSGPSKRLIYWLYRYLLQMSRSASLSAAHHEPSASAERPVRAKVVPSHPSSSRQELDAPAPPPLAPRSHAPPRTPPHMSNRHVHHTASSRSPERESSRRSRACSCRGRSAYSWSGGRRGRGGEGAG